MNTLKWNALKTALGYVESLPFFYSGLNGWVLSAVLLANFTLFYAVMDALRTKREAPHTSDSTLCKCEGCCFDDGFVCGHLKSRTVDFESVEYCDAPELSGDDFVTKYRREAP